MAAVGGGWDCEKLAGLFRKQAAFRICGAISVVIGV